MTFRFKVISPIWLYFHFNLSFYTNVNQNEFFFILGITCKMNKHIEESLLTIDDNTQNRWTIKNPSLAFQRKCLFTMRRHCSINHEFCGKYRRLLFLHMKITSQTKKKWIENLNQICLRIFVAIEHLKTTT